MLINFVYLIMIDDFWCLTPLSTIFQLYHGDQFQWWRKPEYSERNTDHGQATGKLSYLRMRVEYTLFCNLQSRAGTHTILVDYFKFLIYKQKIIMNTFACFMDHENNLSPPLFTGTVHKLHFTSVFYVICLAPIHCKPNILHIHLLV